MISVVSIAGSNRRQIGFDRGLHVGVLQLASEIGVVQRASAMHLSERRCCRRLMLEIFELALPVGAEFGLHAALDERPAHRWRLALQFGKLLDVLRRKRFGDGGEKLRHLHDRALEPAERSRQLCCILAAVEIDAEEPRSRDPCRDTTDIGADPGVAPGAGGEAIGFDILVGTAARRHQRPPASNASSSRIMRSITPRPPSQNFGSLASRPNGLSSSEWCLVPPAASISR
jgi:hypothetical protein